MKLLLDAYRDRRNQILVSVVSAWEMQVKLQIGKLRELKTPLRDVSSRRAAW